MHLEKDAGFTVYYGRFGDIFYKIEAETASARNKAIYDAERILNANFDKVSKKDGYIYADGVVYAVNPSLGHKKITGDVARSVRKCVKELDKLEVFKVELAA